MTYLVHYGVSKMDGAPVGSGRYPLGSGEDPYQDFPNVEGSSAASKFFRDEEGTARVPKFLIDSYEALHKEGMSDADIATSLGYKSQYEMRNVLTSSRAERKHYIVNRAIKLHEDDQWSDKAICQELGISANTLRKYLNPLRQSRENKQEVLKETIRKAVEEQGSVDVGTGVHYHMGVPRNRFNAAVAELEAEGYVPHVVMIEQMGTGNETRMKVLSKPGVKWYDLKRDPSQVGAIVDYTTDGGKTYHKNEPPVNIDSKRIEAVYPDDKNFVGDGLIQIRPGVEDLSLGKSSYAQVRIAVDGTHYLKGMAVYSDDLPDGIDIRFNTSKSRDLPLLGEDKDRTVLKKMKDSENNPFGASVHQYKYIGSDGKEHLSAINKVNDAGDWGENWSRSLSSQFLSKQTPELARKQLSAKLTEMQAEFDDLKTLQNPAVKKKMLEDFADECDSAAVHLKAAPISRQGWHVLIPDPNIPEDKCYCPNYHDGEKVVLVRYPHGGRFEIPELTVSSKEETASARKMVGNTPRDAIVIHPKVAATLSGADFDGDTVIVIPNNEGAIKLQKALKGLEDFEPKVRYKAYPGMKRVGKEDGFDTQKQMGRISNLICDMTIKGATDEELARAVRHSMTVIDAEKHNLDWKSSERANNISELKVKYQGGATRGASTIISRSSAEHRVPHRTEGAYIIDPTTGEQSRYKFKFDPVTGEKLYTYTGKTYTSPDKDREGNIKGWTEKPRTIKSTKMAEVQDARELSSGYEIEEVYAAHANALKQMAKDARLASMAVELKPYDKEARKKYKVEVDELNAALHLADSNAPLERMAQALAGARLKEEKRNNPGMDADDIKKARGRLLTQARADVGAGKQRIKITDRQWEALMAGAMSTTSQLKIFANAEKDEVRRLARPKDRTSLTSSQLSLARMLLADGATQADVADRLGVSTSTLMRLVKE